MKNVLVIFLLAFVMNVFFSFISPGNDIRLDGVISPGEWKDAKECELTKGGKLLIKKQDNELYVALQATKKAWSHVYLLHGDTIKVLHASAALGESKYLKQNNSWYALHAFSWQLRDRVYNDELIKKQQDYYREFGWVANNNNMADGTTFEFKLDISRADDDPVSFACVLSEIPDDIHYFPATLNDNTILLKLLQGYTPDSLQFDPSSWYKIR